MGMGCLRLAACALCLALVGAARPVLVAAGESAAGEAIKAGDIVRVKAGPAPVMDGARKLTEIETGAELLVQRVEGKWVQVKVIVDKAPYLGWIDAVSHLQRVQALPMTAGQTGPVAKAPPDDEFLRPPAFPAPRGRPYPAQGKFIPEEAHLRSTNLVFACDDLKGEYDKYKPTPADYSTMVKLVSEERLVGDGDYVTAGFDAGLGAWAVSIYGVPAVGSKYSANLRLYCNGKGMALDAVKRQFGRPRLEGKATFRVDRKETQGTQLTYGHVTVLWGKAGEFVGVAFYYSPALSADGK